MNLLRLTWRNINDNAFRSWIVYICALMLAAFAVAGTLVIGGAQKSLQLALERLGADIIVVPTGNETAVENALLMGIPVHAWMPADIVDVIAEISGVTAVSPQLYLATLRGATCCSVPEMFLIAYDAETDFTLRPWLESHIEDGLPLGESVGGAFVFLPAGQDYIYIYGSPITLRGKLDATGTGLDQSLFFTFETAREVSRLSPELAVAPLEIPEASISSALVRLDRTADPDAVAIAIKQAVPGVTPMVSTNLFQTQKSNILALSRTVLVLLGIVWALAIALIGLVFSIAINERRRHLGVMRALGATRRDVLVALLTEGGALALSGGLVGGAVTAFAISLFHNLITSLMGGPFLYPNFPRLVLLLIEVLAVTLATVMIAVAIPALKVSFTDPATAMRE